LERYQKNLVDFCSPLLFFGGSLIAREAIRFSAAFSMNFLVYGYKGKQ
jgi:hypothetical protein